MNGAGGYFTAGGNIGGHNLIRMQALREISFSHNSWARA